jgi:hypothetical protein
MSGTNTSYYNSITVNLSGVNYYNIGTDKLYSLEIQMGQIGVLNNNEVKTGLYCYLELIFNSSNTFVNYRWQRTPIITTWDSGSRIFSGGEITTVSNSWLLVNNDSSSGVFIQHPPSISNLTIRYWGNNASVYNCPFLRIRSVI